MRKYDKAITHCNALLKTMRIFRKKIIDNAYLVDSDISAMLYWTKIISIFIEYFHKIFLNFVLIKNIKKYDSYSKFNVESKPICRFHLPWVNHKILETRHWRNPRKNAKNYKRFVKRRMNNWTFFLCSFFIAQVFFIRSVRKKAEKN